MSELDNLFGAAKAAESSAPAQTAPKTDKGGLDALAPKMPKPAAQTSPQTASQTPKTPDTGIGGLVGNAGADASAFGKGLAAQYRSVLGSAYEAARKRMRFGAQEQKPAPFGATPFAQQMGEPNAQTAPAAPKPSAPEAQSAPSAPAQPQLPQVTEGRGLFGGTSRQYRNGNNTVEIPQDIGSDEKSVRAFMDEMDAISKATFDIYAEEE